VCGLQASGMGWGPTVVSWKRGTEPTVSGNQELSIQLSSFRQGPLCTWTGMQTYMYLCLFGDEHLSLSNKQNNSPPYQNLSIPLTARNMGHNNSPRLRVVSTWSVITAVFSYSLVNNHVKIMPWWTIILRLMLTYVTSCAINLKTTLNQT